MPQLFYRLAYFLRHISTLIYVFIFVTVGMITIQTVMYSQRFDWQLSQRLPFTIPKHFIGIYGGYGVGQIQGNATLIAPYEFCTNFTESSLHLTTIGFSSEYWLLPEMAIRGGIRYESQSRRHTAIENTPLFDGRIVTTENSLSTIYSAFVVEASVKQRLPRTFAWGSVGFSGAMLLTESHNQRNQVRSPSDYTFIVNGQRTNVYEQPLRQQTLMSGFIPRLNVSLGYDLSLKNLWYCSPFLTVDVPLSNETLQSNVRGLTIRIGFSLLYGI